LARGSRVLVTGDLHVGSSYSSSTKGGRRSTRNRRVYDGNRPLDLNLSEVNALRRREETQLVSSELSPVLAKPAVLQATSERYPQSYPLEFLGDGLH
jgi:hypothetical protein